MPSISDRSTATAVHYFFNPFAPEVFAEVLKGIVASYHARPRRLYVILIDMDAAELMHKTGVFQELKLPLAKRMQAQAAQPLHDQPSTARSPESGRPHRSRRAASPRPHDEEPLPHGEEALEKRAVSNDEAERPRYFTPSFFCRLDDEVVYWKISFLSG